MKKFIAIAGTMGAGKSSLVEFLHFRYGFEPIYEPFMNNPYLDDFYKDMKRWSFQSQIYFLTHKFRLHIGLPEFQNTVIQDRTIYEDAIFAKTLVNLGLMDERDYRTYLSLFKNMSNFMCRPNIIVYLDISPETSMARIKERSRDVESEISLDYLKMLQSEYEVFIEEIARTIPVIRVSWEKYHDANEMAEVIEREYLDTSFIREASWNPVRAV